MRSGSPFPCALSQTDPSSVLLVQSNPLHRHTCTTVLEDAGLTVHAVPDGATACEWIDSCPPDIVVTDLLLRDMDGGVLCRRLREHPPTCDAQIFAVSKSTTSADYVRAVKIGFDLLLKDPCDPSTLAREIARVRVRAAGLRRRADLVVARATLARSDAATALAQSLAVRDKYERWTQADAVARIRSAYYELPGLNLTIAQAARFWHLSSNDCAAALVELVHRQLLVCRDGAFCLRRSSPAVRSSVEMFPQR